jgi:hypothetical protein
MDAQHAQALATFVTQCQVTLFVLTVVPAILKQYGLRSSDKAFSDKVGAYNDLVEALQKKELNDAVKQDMLRKALTEKSYRAKRCLTEGVQTIFKALVLRITKDDLARWGDLIEEWFDDLARQFKIRTVKHLHVSGEGGVGKSSAYPLALHMCIYGYPPDSDLHDSDNLKDLLTRVDIDPAWTDDCINVRVKDDCDEPASSFAYVSVHSCYATLLVAFLTCRIYQVRGYTNHDGCGSGVNKFKTVFEQASKSRHEQQDPRPLVALNMVDEMCIFSGSKKQMMQKIIK